MKNKSFLFCILASCLAFGEFEILDPSVYKININGVESSFNDVGNLLLEDLFHRTSFGSLDGIGLIDALKMNIKIDGFCEVGSPVWYVEYGMFGRTNTKAIALVNPETKVIKYIKGAWIEPAVIDSSIEYSIATYADAKSLVWNELNKKTGQNVNESDQLEVSQFFKLNFEIENFCKTGDPVWCVETLFNNTKITALVNPKSKSIAFVRAPWLKLED